MSDRLALQHEQEESRRQKVARIERIIEDRAFTMFFQPILDLHSGTMAGVEALARFSAEPSRTPDRWFEEAWSLGLDLELAAATMALQAAQTRAPQGFLEVNVSPGAAISPRFLEFVSAQDGASTLVIELTEHAVVEDYDVLTPSLDRLRQMGMRVAVDDAGAGYASLRHILLVKPDLIKLDVSLIAGIDDDQDKRALAAGITSFAREVGTKVVAEGIEGDGDGIVGDVGAIQSDIKALQQDFTTLQADESNLPSYLPADAPTQKSVNTAIANADGAISSAIATANGDVTKANGDVALAFQYAAGAFDAGSCGTPPAAPTPEPPVSS